MSFTLTKATRQERSCDSPPPPRKRWLVLAIGIAAQVAFSSAFSGLPAAGNQLRAAYGLSLQQLGVILAAIYLGIVISELAWGLLTDYIGERFVLVCGLLGTATVLILLGLFSHQLGLGQAASIPLAVGFLFLGILGGSVNGSSGRAVMAWFRTGERGLAMSLRQTAIPVGGALGAAVLPTLAAASGSVVVFGFLASICILPALAALFWLTTPPVQSSSMQMLAAKSERKIKKVSPNPLSNSVIWRIAIASALLTVPQFAVITFVPAFFRQGPNPLKGMGL